MATLTDDDILMLTSMNLAEGPGSLSQATLENTLSQTNEILSEFGVEGSAFNDLQLPLTFAGAFRNDANPVIRQRAQAITNVFRSAFAGGPDDN